MTTGDTCWTTAVAACCGNENGPSPVLISLKKTDQAPKPIERTAAADEQSFCIARFQLGQFRMRVRL
jgi:hypothetical protein